MSTTARQMQEIRSHSQAAPATLSAIKAKMKATWEDGNYAKFATYMEAGATDILTGWNISNDAVLLDIGCGSGQTAIPAARLGMSVTGIDLADNLIDYARERARFEGLSARFDVGDAESLPYKDKHFNVVITLIGAIRK